MKPLQQTVLIGSKKHAHFTEAASNHEYFKSRWYIHYLSLPYLDSDYGQLSLETWTFLHDIYDGGPVFFIEGEKEIEEKKDQQEQEEEVQQEWRYNSSGQF